MNPVRRSSPFKRERSKPRVHPKRNFISIPAISTEGFSNGVNGDGERVRKMKRVWFPLVGLGCLVYLLMTGLPSYAQKQPKNLTLLYSNNLNGEIEPCPT
jgi:hypothetical protein